MTGFRESKGNLQEIQYGTKVGKVVVTWGRGTKRVIRKHSAQHRTQRRVNRTIIQHRPRLKRTPTIRRASQPHIASLNAHAQMGPDVEHRNHHNKWNDGKHKA
jgi:hypothetical protein